MSLLRLSKWTYTTGATGGVSIEFVVASGGTIVLNDPAQQEQDFHYGGIGVGLGFGAKLPKIKLPKMTLPELRLPKVAGREVGGAGSAKSFPSSGSVYMTNAFRGDELTRSNIQGGTIYVDAGAGLFVGEAGSAMLLGINPAMLTLGIMNPGFAWLLHDAIAHAPAVLVMHGLTAGVQAGAGVGLLAGYLH
jgi:hypothetical protein